MTRRDFLTVLGAAPLAGVAAPLMPRARPGRVTVYPLNKRYNTIQAALDALWTHQGSVTFSPKYPAVGAWKAALR